MDDGNWAEDLANERKQRNIEHIDFIRNELMVLRNDRKDDKKLFVKLTQCIGFLYGLKEDLWHGI